MTNDIVPAGGTNPLALLERAIEKGVNPDQLGKLMDLCERWEANRAKAAYAAAVAKFQSECPRVYKRRTATVEMDKGGKYQYQFASYDDVMDQAGPVMAQCGISVSFTTKMIQGGMECTCLVRVGTHVEPHTSTVPLPAQMKVNDTQRFGAALKYAQRYTICPALNIVVTDDPDDDASRLVDYITPEQAKEIRGLIEQKGIKVGALLHWVQAEGVDKIMLRDYAKTVDFLKRKADVKKAEPTT